MSLLMFEESTGHHKVSHSKSGRKPIEKFEKEVEAIKSKEAKSKALKKKKAAGKMSSVEGINKARKEQGYKPKKFDRATKGLYDFLDKYDK